jgi:hypothetical protein
MSRHRNYRHERFAQALAEGKSRAEAMIVAGYKSHRGNQNRLAQLPDVVARVEETVMAIARGAGSNPRPFATGRD